MVTANLIILLGDDEVGKRQKIASLQNELFPPELKDLNFSIFYGDDKRLTEQSFKEQLMCLPIGAAQNRLFVIKTAHKLKKSFLRCLKEALGKMREHLVVIADIDDAKASDAFIDEFSGFTTEIIRFKTRLDRNVFDLGRAILRHQPERALCLLSGFAQSRERADKILGAVFWQWENAYNKGQISNENYSRGLKFILDADKRMKSTSSFFARQSLILEMLVVKLSYLT